MKKPDSTSFIPPCAGRVKGRHHEDWKVKKKGVITLAQKHYSEGQHQ